MHVRAGPCVLLLHGWKLPQGRKSCSCHRGRDQAWQEQGTPQCRPPQWVFVPSPGTGAPAGSVRPRAPNRAQGGEVRLEMGNEVGEGRSGACGQRQRQNRSPLTLPGQGGMGEAQELPREGGGAEPPLGCRCEPGRGCGPGMGSAGRSGSPALPRTALAILVGSPRCAAPPGQPQAAREGEREGAAVAPPHTGIPREVRGELGRARLEPPHHSPGAPARGRGEGKTGSRRWRYCSFLSLRRSNAIVQSY